MSSDWRSISAVWVASFSEGEGAQPQAEPLPVVKQIRVEAMRGDQRQVMNACPAVDRTVLDALEHLEASCIKVIRRAELVRASSAPPDRAYID